MQSDEPGLQVSATYNSEDIHFNYKLGSLGSYYQATHIQLMNRMLHTMERQSS